MSFGNGFGFSNTIGWGFGVSNRSGTSNGNSTVTSVTTSVASIAGEPGQVVTFSLTARNSAGKSLNGKVYSAVSASPATVRVDSVVGKIVTCSILAQTSGINVVGTCETINATPVSISGAWVLASLLLSPSPSSVAVGASVNLTAAARNRFGLTMPLPTIVGTSTATSVATIGTIASSAVPINGVNAGTSSIRVRSGAVISNAVAVSVTAVSVALVPTSIRVTPSTLYPEGGTVVDITARLLDQAGDPISGSGYVITWSDLTGSGGTFAFPTSTTDAAGVATVTLLVSEDPDIVHTVRSVAGALIGTSAAIAVQTASGGAGGFSGPAELPRRVPNTNWSTPAATGTLFTVTTAVELQAAIDAAVDGDRIQLAAGFQIATNYTIILRNRGSGTGYVHICVASKFAGTFALTPSVYTRGVSEVQGQRVGPRHSYGRVGAASPLAQIRTDSYLPAVSCEPGAHHWWFEGIEFAVGALSPGIESAIVNTGGVEDSYVTAMADVPHHINFGHCLFSGRPGTNVRRGLYANGEYVGVRDFSIFDIRAVGTESAGIAGWNTPGAFSAINGFIDAGAQAVLFGGAGPLIPDLVMADFTTQWVHMTKNPTYGVKKNAYEHKNGIRALVRYCIMEHNAPTGQSGTNVLFQTLNDNNLSPAQQDISDLTLDMVLIIGGGALFALVGRAGYSLGGEAIVWPAAPTRRIHIRNIYGRNVAGTLAEAAGSTAYLFQFSTGVKDLLIEHVTAEGASAALITTGRATIEGVDVPAVENIEVRDSLLGRGLYGSILDTEGHGQGSAALAAVAVNANIHNNVFYGNTAEGGDNAAAYPAGNTYLPTPTGVGFASRVAQDPGALAVSSAYHNAGTDGEDLGADVTAMLAMETAVRETSLPW